MDSDENEDGEPLLYTFGSHFKLMIKFIVGLSVNWTTLEYLLNSLKLFIMRTETFILFISLFVIYVCCYSSDFWPNLVAKRLPAKWLIKLGLVNKVKTNYNCISSTDELIINNVGIYAMQGRRPKMEDTFSYCDETKRFGLQMFGVFDGHGGASASKVVQNRLFTSIIEAIENETKVSQSSSSLNDDKYDAAIKSVNQADESNPLNSAVNNDCKSNLHSSWKLSGEGGDEGSCEKKGQIEKEIRPKDVSRIISQQIISLDKELVQEMKEKNDVSGTTALVAVNMVKEKTLIVANVGDSRAVLCDQKGNVIPLSFDHKPQQIKERKRITEAGGFVQFNGVWRVAGILATSRALGDYPLKDNNFVIPDPDILSFDLNHVKPKFMILASDGLWDILSNEEAADFVRMNLEMLKKRSWTKTPSTSTSIAHELAKSLVLQSYKKGSLDNITVIVVLFDL